MRMMKLAFLNFKSNFKNYLSLVISLAFTILIFLNFQNVVYSDALDVLGTQNKNYVDILIQVISLVLGCFMFFFIWYSTNVFLTKRKREIGIYVFMGLSNQRIAKLYMIETTLIGLSALFLGIFFGILTTGLFQMVLLALSDIAVDISFRFTLPPIFITAGVYLAVYLLFVLKGYFNIVRSSVLNMITGTRQNEYIRQKVAILWLKSVLGIGVLGLGFYMAVKEGGQEVMGNAFAAVALVIAGVYLLFGGLIPLIFQGLAKNKHFLYCKQRCLWINNVIFRMKKNYRTYAMVCILVLCSVTALATGFAMKYRYDNMLHFENTYTFQLVSNQPDPDEQARELIEKKSKIAYSTRIKILALDGTLVHANVNYGQYAVVAYTELKKLAADAHLEFDLEEPADDEVIRASHLYLLSLITDRSRIQLDINGKTYRQTEEVNVPYLGYLQEQMSFYVVNDEEYEKLLPLGKELYTYNYRIENLNAFEEARALLDELVSDTEENYTGRIAVNPQRGDKDWIKVLYSLCIFMFMVFILASGSIMFMKLYNDAFEEKERYLVMKKMGFEERTLLKSIARELGTAYAVPFAVMLIASYFSVHALEKMMYTSLWSIHLVSVLVVFVIFLICYLLSVTMYKRNVGI
ncbi:MAG: ABC transporter permease [Bacillota bacterium]|nr:ABC transporter permease [Bacillota bacterium]